MPMVDPLTVKGNGPTSSEEHATENQFSLGEHGRRLHHDGVTLAAEIQDAGAGIEQYLTAQVTRRPYATLGIAAGVGYVLGGGPRSRLTAVVVTGVTRLATLVLANEAGRLFVHRDPTPTELNRG